MKLTIRTLAVSLIALLSVAVATGAGAATQRTTITVDSGRLYRIDMGIEKAEQSVRVSSLVLAERREQARITPCLLQALLPIFKAADAKSIANANTALYKLSTEAGIEYEIAAIKPVITPAVNGASRMLKFPLPAALRSRLQSYKPAFAALGSFNACADARAWYAADLVAAHEPKGTAHTNVALTNLHKLDGNLEIEFSGLTRSQLQTRELQKKRTDKHLNALESQAVGAIKSWVQKLVRALEHKAAATSTTTTNATTTGTNTTPTLTQPAPTVTVGPPTSATG